ncbi:MAG: NAD(P)/FAD-dependent oxidoreductase [Actinomycetes bacterium]
MTHRVVILGAGFGGLELATTLSERAADDVTVTVIDQSDCFVFGFSKLEVMFGHTSTESVRAYYREIDKPSVEFRQEVVTAIDPAARRVSTYAGEYEADVLVVALGADLDPSATPGLVEHGHEFYSVEGAERLADVLPTFSSGHAVVGVVSAPYKCPPAPSEAAFLLHDFLTERGVRDAVDITVVSPLGTPVPVSAETSEAILKGFAERDITYVGGDGIRTVEPGQVTLRSGGTRPCDLLLGVPQHVVPPVVAAAGLTENGWVPVRSENLATRFPGVYAMGDVASAPVPRAGVFAENAATAVADDIIAGIRGSAAVPYDGAGSCYIEFGGGRVARVDATFITAGGPTAPFTPPSPALAEEKERFAATRLHRWFGRPAPPTE